jgi:hypothetical protein
MIGTVGVFCDVRPARHEVLGHMTEEAVGRIFSVSDVWLPCFNGRRLAEIAVAERPLLKVSS